MSPMRPPCTVVDVPTVGHLPVEILAHILLRAVHDDLRELIRISLTSHCFHDAADYAISIIPRVRFRMRSPGSQRAAEDPARAVSYQSAVQTLARCRAATTLLLPSLPQITAPLFYRPALKDPLARDDTLTETEPRSLAADPCPLVAAGFPLHRLQCLHLTYARLFWADVPPAFTAFPPMPVLRELDLTGCMYVKDLRGTLRHSPRLEKLVLSWCRDLVHLVDPLPPLPLHPHPHSAEESDEVRVYEVHIDSTFPSGMRGRSGSRSEGSPQDHHWMSSLVELTVDGCEQLDIASLVISSRMLLPRLRYFSGCHCPRVNDEWLHEVACGGLPRLQTLALSGSNMNSIWTGVGWSERGRRDLEQRRPCIAIDIFL
jgi:hypothetical protein